MGFEGIFEIGPVDGQTSRILNADGTSWNVLLPMCDGDVFNLQGVRPFDRMMLIRTEAPAAPKSTFTVWGANHNFYNTEWQLSDSPGCLGHKRLFDHLLGSPDQRTTALASVLAFFRGHVGASANPAFATLFNPQFDFPASVGDVTRIDRGYSDSPNAAVTRTFDDFNQPTGFNSSGAANTASNVTVAHGGIANHSTQQRVAQIAWKSPGSQTFFQSNWTPPGVGQNVTAFKTLDFRVARQCGDAACTKTDAQWLFATSFSVRLVAADGSLSTAFPISNYLTLTGPVGGLVTFIGTSPHPILQTIRIPLSAFGRSTFLNQLRGVRFTFDDTKADEIFIGNIRLSTISAVNAAQSFALGTLGGDDSVIPDSTATTDVSQVKSLREVTLSGGSSEIEIELSSNREFLPQGELLVLRIGNGELTSSRYPSSGETGTVTFTMSPEEFAALPDGAPITVQYGVGHDHPGWKFGHLNKGQLAR